MRYIRRFNPINESSSNETRLLDLIDILTDFFDENSINRLPDYMYNISDEDDFGEELNVLLKSGPSWSFIKDRFSNVYKDVNTEINGICLYNMRGYEKLEKFLKEESDRIKDLCCYELRVNKIKIEDGIFDIEIFLDEIEFDSEYIRFIKDITIYQWNNLTSEKKDKINSLLKEIKNIIES